MKTRKVIHELKGHKQDSAVTSLSVHPSGKVALSTARDNSIRMWDLVSAKAAPRTIFQRFATLSCICWSPGNGNFFALVGDDKTVLIMDSFSVTETPLGSFVHPKRVNALRFIQDVILASACDDGHIRIIGVDGSISREFTLDTPSRARDVAFLSRMPNPKSEGDVDDDDEEEIIVAGAFHDGTIRLWSLENDENDPIAVLNLGTVAHITCMVMSWIDLADKKALDGDLPADRKKMKKDSTMN